MMLILKLWQIHLETGAVAEMDETVVKLSQNIY